MKKYAFILISIFLVSVLAVPVALASVSIPPSDPGNNPIGPSISYEQIQKIKMCEEWYQNYKERVCWGVVSVPNPPANLPPTYSPSAGYDPECIRRAARTLNECIEGILNPPKLILPNGNSPGGN